MSESLTHKTAKASAWSVFDVIFRQGVGFVISIILARLLTPSDYGTIAMMMIFIGVANVFVDSGFSSGLIRKIDRTQDDLSTAFFFNIIVGTFVYVILFVCAPAIASFFDNTGLTIYLRVLGLILITNSLNLVQNAILISSMRIKQMTFVSATAQTTTGIIAIILAYHGWGVWSLVFQQLGASIIQAFLLVVVTKWHPNLVFSKKSFGYLWNYGSKLLAANLIGNIFGQAYSFVVGKLLGKKNLGLYSRSDQFAIQPENIINNIINKALVPSLAECQNDLGRLRKNYSKCVEIIAAGIFPLMFTLGIAAEPIFKVLFGSKWDDAIPIFKILCFGYAFDVFSYISLNLMQVMGRTDYTLKLEFIKKPIFALILAVAFWGGLKGLAIGKASYSLISTLINLSVIKFLLKYNYWKQVKDILKYAIMALFILIPSYGIISLISSNNLFRCISFPILGIGIYIVVCNLTKMNVFTYTKEIINKK